MTIPPATNTLASKAPYWSIPVKQPVVDAKGLITRPWYHFFMSILGSIQGQDALNAYYDDDDVSDSSIADLNNLSILEALGDSQDQLVDCLDGFLFNEEAGTQSDPLMDSMLAYDEPIINAPQPEQVITLGSSPYIYTAPLNGTIFLYGGSVSVVSISRDGVNLYPIPSTLGVPPIPMSKGDQVKITYSSPPASAVFFPS